MALTLFAAKGRSQKGRNVKMKTEMPETCVINPLKPKAPFKMLCKGWAELKHSKNILLKLSFCFNGDISNGLFFMTVMSYKRCFSVTADTKGSESATGLKSKSTFQLHQV